MIMLYSNFIILINQPTIVCIFIIIIIKSLKFNLFTGIEKKKKNDLLNPNDLNNLGESGNYISNQIIDIDNIVRKENTHAGLKVLLFI